MRKDRILKLKDYSFTYQGKEKRAFTPVNLDILKGECHCITGPTGSGKSTLLLGIRGLLPAGSEDGTIERIYPDSIGIILQNPETQILRSTIGEEAAFGLENLCVPTEDMEPIVKAALEKAGLEKPLSFNTTALSMGQKYRLLISSFIVMEPGLFLLDEPCAQLDPEGVKDLVKIISALKKQGTSFIICEHSPSRLSSVIDNYWSLDKDHGVITKDISEAEQQQYKHFRENRGLSENNHQIVEVKELYAGGNNNKPVISDLSFTLNKGESLVLYGPNGSGKTTLLRTLTGLIKPFSGSIRINGDIAKPALIRKTAGCLFQNPERQLFENTVIEEVAFSMKRHGAGKKQAFLDAEKILTDWGMEHLIHSSAHRLSYGQKHLVAMVSALSHRPALIILDDPFAGLDRRWVELILSILDDAVQCHGASLILATHEPDMLSQWSDNTLSIGKEFFFDTVQ